MKKRIILIALIIVLILGILFVISLVTLILLLCNKLYSYGIVAGTVTLILFVKKVPAAVFIGLVVTAIIGVIFTALGFGAGDMLMPAVPAQFVSANFDLSLFAGL